MAIETYQYVDSVKYAAVPIWATGVHAVGELCRPNAATQYNERVHVCVTAGTSSGTEPVGLSGTTRGAQTSDSGGVVWQECTGRPAMNGSVLKTVDWNSVKNTAVLIGLIIKDIAAANYFIVDVAGTCGNGAEPTWNTTPGNTTADGGTTWRCLGAVTSFTAAFAAPHNNIGNTSVAGWFANGDTCLVGHQHNVIYINSSYNINETGSDSARNKYLCVSNTVADPTTTTSGAKESVTISGSITIQGGFADFVGIGWYTGLYDSTHINISTPVDYHSVTFTNCIFNPQDNGGNPYVSIGPAGSYNDGAYIKFKNCWFRFGKTSAYMVLAKGIFIFEDCNFADTGTAPSNLFYGSAGCTTNTRIIGGDASNISGSLFSPGTGAGHTMTIENLKLNASVSPVTGAFGSLNQGSFIMSQSDSTTGTYRKYYADYNGTIQTETTIVHTGGATDGTTPISWNVASSANATFRTPLQIGEFRFWNDVVGSSQTVTMELTTNTALNTADLGLSIDYLNSASFPTTAKVTSLPASTFDSTSALTTSSEVWGGTAQTYKYKIAVSYTPLMKGFVKGNLYLSKASSGAIYIDPKFVAAGLVVTRSEQFTISYITETNAGVLNRGLRSGIEL
jgi:hypothetical protein